MVGVNVIGAYVIPLGRSHLTTSRGGLRPLWVKSGNAHNEPMMSAFHPITTK
jgi:hypothetical protein